MATLAQIQAVVDTWVANNWPSVQARQATYIAGLPAYFQGIGTPTPTPADGATAAPDWTLRPSYQAATWAGVMAFPATALQGTIRIDQYDGPQGKGYVLTLTIVSAGRTWSRSIQVGPETWRAMAWADVTPVVF